MMRECPYCGKQTDISWPEGNGRRRFYCTACSGEWTRREAPEENTEHSESDISSGPSGAR